MTTAKTKEPAPELAEAPEHDNTRAKQLQTGQKPKTEEKTDGGE